MPDPPNPPDLPEPPDPSDPSDSEDAPPPVHHYEDASEESSLLSTVLKGFGIALGVLVCIFILGFAVLFVVCSRMAF